MTRAYKTIGGLGTTLSEKIGLFNPSPHKHGADNHLQTYRVCDDSRTRAVYAVCFSSSCFNSFSKSLFTCSGAGTRQHARSAHHTLRLEILATHCMKRLACPSPRPKKWCRYTMYHSASYDRKEGCTHLLQLAHFAQPSVVGSSGRPSAITPAQPRGAIGR